MIIPKKILSKWRVLKSASDAKKLSALMGGKYPEVFTRALRDGVCNDEVFEVMAKFYEDKAKMVKEFL